MIFNVKRDITVRPAKILFGILKQYGRPLEECGRPYYLVEPVGSAGSFMVKGFNEGEAIELIH